MAMLQCYFVVSLFIFSVNGNIQRSHEDNIESVRATLGRPWPEPQQINVSPEQYVVDPRIFTFASNQNCDLLEMAFERYKKTIFGESKADSTLRFKPHQKQHVNVLDDIVITMMVEVKAVCKPGAYPSLDSDESYNLTISGAGVGHITANEVWGALRALETFSQIIITNAIGMYYTNVTDIVDFPRFKHRGLLVDTSRHFLSMNVLKANLDVMAINKLNVFHWHIVDDPSFPYDSSTFPDMSRKGSYDPLRHVYSQQDVKEIIEYARQRGIRVIPEFDSPGHTQSWGKSITNLLTECYSHGKFNGNYGPVNPVPNTTYTFLQEFFSEIRDVFPDQYVHLGGDEVGFGCWASNPNVEKFMIEKGFGLDYRKLEEYYMQNLLNIVGGLNKGYIIWQEVIDNGAKVALDTVVQVWKGNYQSELTNVTKLGYKSLLSSCWYLDYIAYGAQWKTYYVCDPQEFNGTEAQKELVIGGEACIWGEYVDDTNLLSRTWPRASAVAERLWSAANVNDTTQAAPRLEEHRCRMIRRGYPAEPANGPGMCDVEYDVVYNNKATRNGRG